MQPPEHGAADKRRLADVDERGSGEPGEVVIGMALGPSHKVASAHVLELGLDGHGSLCRLCRRRDAPLAGGAAKEPLVSERASARRRPVLAKVAARARSRSRVLMPFQGGRGRRASGRFGPKE